MTKKKRRHIRWDRVLLLLMILVGIIFSIIFILDQQKKNREAISVTLIQDGVVYELNAEEFVDFKKGLLILDPFKDDAGIGDPMPTIEELQAMQEDTNDEQVSEEGIYLGEFRTTAYCNCSDCCGQWAGGPCYNGEMPVAGWTIAVDKNVIPINSLVSINGHIYKAMDTGSAIIGNRIDIYCDSHQECFNAEYNGYVDVYLIEEGE